MYLDRQGANAFHPQPSLNYNLNKASLNMARLSMQLALPQAVSCHTKIRPNFFTIEHN